MNHTKSKIQFGSRLLLLLMAMASVGFAWVRISQSNQSREAWGRLKQKAIAGNSSDVRHQVASPSELELLARRDSHLVKELRISAAESLTENDFARLSSFENLGSLYLHYEGLIRQIPSDFQHCPSLTELHLSLVGQHVGREHVRQISRLDLLKSLDLSATDVTDEEVAIILENTKLTGLRLGMTDVTDESVKRLSELAPSLRLLELTETKVTGQGLRFLSQLSNLEQLYLARLNLADTELTHLFTLRKLRWLSIPRENLSVDAIQTVQSNLPECIIND